MLPGMPDFISSRSCQFLQPEYTLDLLEMENDYHTDVIRSKLTRNIAVTFKEVRDELIKSLDATIPMHGDGAWKICCQKLDFLSSCGTQIGSKFP